MRYLLSFGPVVLAMAGAASAETFDARQAVDELVGPPDYAQCLPGLDLDGLQASASVPEPADGAPKLKRLVIAVDASGSMAGSVGGTSKMEVAKRETLAFLDQLPKGVGVSLVGFGHRGDNTDAGKAASCSAVETLATADAGDRGSVRAAIEGLAATGWTPLADAIRAAGDRFEEADEVGEQVVWIVSDGRETCGGDAVAAARALREGCKRVTINIVGLDLPARDRRALRAVSDAGGGVFLEAAATPGDMRAKLATVVATGRAQLAGNVSKGMNAIRTARAGTSAIGRPPSAGPV